MKAKPDAVSRCAVHNHGITTYLSVCTTERRCNRWRLWRRSQRYWRQVHQSVERVYLRFHHHRHRQQQPPQQLKQ